MSLRQGFLFVVFLLASFSAASSVVTMTYRSDSFTASCGVGVGDTFDWTKLSCVSGKNPVTYCPVKVYHIEQYASGVIMYKLTDCGNHKTYELYTKSAFCAPPSQINESTGICEEPPECSTDLMQSQARWDEALYGNSPVYCIDSCEGKRKGSVVCPSGTCFGDIYGTGNECEGSGIISGNGGGSEGGDTGGSEGGDTEGSEGGDTGGSEGGDTEGSEGGDTGGSEGGDTGGSTGGSTGGGSSGSGQAAFDDSAILNRIDSLKSATTGAIGSVKDSVDGVATGVQGINDKLDNLLGNDRKFTQPQQSGWMNSIMQKPIENLQASTEQLKDELEEKLHQSPLKLGTMDFNNGDYTGTSFALTRSGWSVDVDFNLFGILGSNTELIRNVIIFAAALMAAFIILSSGRKN